MLSPGGEKLYSFGSHGSGQGELVQPRGVAIDRHGNILVVDSGNRRLQKFTAQGKFLKAVGGKNKAGSEQFQLLFRRDISLCSSHSKVYLVDQNHCIRILNSDLTCYQSFGGFGKEEGKFHELWGTACDSKGNIYVADGFNDRIQVFNAKGKFLKTIGRRGNGRGELNFPAGVAVDASGWVYVCDQGNCRVCVFTTGGEFVTSFRGGGKHGEFGKSLCGIAVDSSSGVVYVCDHSNNRIHIVI